MRKNKFVVEMLLTAIRVSLVLLLDSILIFGPRPLDAQSSQPNDPAIPAGHSMHGEAFNEGPRQKAELMKAMGNVSFPVTTQNPLAQKFFNQGIAQLHGFWYFEAERSFRQVALLDPDCAMAYWGMAMANTQNAKRAKGLIKEAVARKAKVTFREQMWIDSLAKFYDEQKRDEKTRKKDYAADLEAIFKAYPDDHEARAFYGKQVWDNGNLTAVQREQAEKALNEVLAANPLHPCHHYRIHLWNYNKDENALNSAARCGQSAPRIAHMWHMPGHTYSQLKQYDQAAWQQEASARVDHAHMMRYRILPDQIHNYAHNNEWLIRTLSFLGRVHDAIDLAMNMIELPRHPKYNLYDKWGSVQYGRHRLVELLTRYELWDEILRLLDTPYLEPTDKPAMQGERLYLAGLAHLNKGAVDSGVSRLSDLSKHLSNLEAQQKAAFDKAEEEARKTGKPDADVTKARNEAGRNFNGDIEKAKSQIAELEAYASLVKGDLTGAKQKFESVRGIPKDRLARIQLVLGDKEQAEKNARDAANNARNEVQPLANLVYVLRECGKAAEAEEKFRELRKLAAHADLDTPVMRRLSPLAQDLHLSADWRLEPDPRSDVGARPNLDDLGPFRWQPTQAPSWTLSDSTGKRFSLKGYRGKPVLVVFFLGQKCVHCMAQLNLFAPAQRAFKEAGIEIVAISTDSAEGLRKTLMSAADKTPFPFPIVSDQKLEVFKSYRCYDDFEKTPLHGTFLVDGKGQVRWHDISYEPFTEIPFLLEESKRLLSQGLQNGAKRTAQRRRGFRRAALSQH